MNKKHNSKPFFSVILPTKGRPELTRLCVESVLNQNFFDYEFVLVDNDDGDETFHALNGLLDHDNLCYIRTGGLTMVENWKTALSYFNGAYLLWMDSKSFFYPNAFESLAKYLALKAEPEVVSWKYDFVHDKGNAAKFVRIKHSNSTVRLSAQVLEDFLNYRLDRNVWAQMPRGVCTSISQSVFAKIKTSFDGEVFSTIAPDVILLLKILSVTEKVYYFPTSLTCVASTKVSGGSNLAARKIGFSYLQKADSTSLEEKMLVPFSNKKIVANLVANDIEKVLNREVPVWQTHRTGYKKSVAREVGSTLGRVGNVYDRKELFEIIKFLGFDLRPYYILLKRYLRCTFILHFDKLSLNFRQRLLTLTVLKNQEIDLQDVKEINLDAYKVSQILLKHGRNWESNES